MRNQQRDISLMNACSITNQVASEKHCPLVLPMHSAKCHLKVVVYSVFVDCVKDSAASIMYHILVLNCASLMLIMLYFLYARAVSRVSSSTFNRTSCTHALAHAQPALKEVAPTVFHPISKLASRIFQKKQLSPRTFAIKALSLIAHSHNEATNC